MLDERGSGFGAVAVEEIDDAGREAGFADELAEDEDAEGSLFGGFEYDGVAAGESGSEFPGGHGERVVPGNDLRHDSDGLTEGVGELLMCRADGLAMGLVCPAGIVANGQNGLGEVGIQCFVVGFAVIPGIDGGKELPILLQEIGQFGHELTSLRAREEFPRRVLESFGRCLDCNVHILLAGSLHRGNLLLCCRVDGSDGLTTLGGYEFVVDEEARRLSVLASIGSYKVHSMRMR